MRVLSRGAWRGRGSGTRRRRSDLDDRSPAQVVDYDYDWQDPCRKWGKAAFWLLIPAGLIKLVSMLCLYKRTYATERRESCSQL